jgi:two-component system cell cycle sensor histidine kinase/response regulator CckA
MDDRRAMSKETKPFIPQVGTETILLVEDEDPVRVLAQRALLSLGYTVLVAEDGKRALEQIAGHEGEIHLLLTDVVMPGMSGVELFDRVQQLRPEINVLYMSGYTDEAALRRGVIEPGRSLLHKPFTFAALAERIRKVLDRSHREAPQ